MYPVHKVGCPATLMCHVAYISVKGQPATDQLAGEHSQRQLTEQKTVLKTFPRITIIGQETTKLDTPIIETRQ